MVDVAGADEDKAVAHCRNDAVRGVPSGGDSADDGDAALPCQRSSAVAADVALPAAIVDFAQGSKYGASCVAVHTQDACKILDDQQSVVAQLAQQPAGRALDVALLR